MIEDQIFNIARKVTFGSGVLFMITGIGWIVCGTLELGIRDVIAGAVLAYFSTGRKA